MQACQCPLHAAVKQVKLWVRYLIATGFEQIHINRGVSQPLVQPDGFARSSWSEQEKTFWQGTAATLSTCR